MNPRSQKNRISGDRIGGFHKLQESAFTSYKNRLSQVTRKWLQEYKNSQSERHPDSDISRTEMFAAQRVIFARTTRSADTLR